MKKITMWLLVCALLVSLAPSAFVGTAYAETNQVKLLFAKAAAGCQSACYEFSGAVEVNNVAYQKEVYIHYSTGNGQWSDIPATYAGKTEGNLEAWTFKKTINEPGKQIQFVVKYVVNGQTYWDNNNNQDYRIGGGSVPDRLLAKSYLALDEAGIGPSNSFSGRIYLKNVAYAKKVKIKYTTDNWATFQEREAAFAEMLPQSNNSLEYWDFQINIPPNTQELKYVVAFIANGVTYWDNNFNLNYTLGLPPQLTLTPSSASATAGTAVNLTVRASDKFGSPLKGFPVNVTSTGSAVVPAVVNTDANGQAQITVSNQKAETVVVTASLNGYSAKGTATVQFLPGQPASLVLQTDTPQIAVGQTVSIKAKLMDLNGNGVPNQTILWSRTGSVALPSTSVTDSKGETVVQASNSAAETATVTATSANGIKGTLQLTTRVPVAGIMLNKPSLKLQAGKQEQLTVIYTPSNSSNKKVVWSSSDPAIASVTQDGLVTAVSPGSATIKAVTEDGGYTAQSAVTVISADAIQAIERDNKIVHPNDQVGLHAVVANEGDIVSYAWSADKGTIAGTGGSVIWTAPEQYGFCEIAVTVTTSAGQTERKTIVINVVPLSDTTDPYGQLDPNEDTDGDVLMNSEEIALGTSPWSKDTDHDGLSDSREVQLHTNPCAKDTDGDGVYDGAEASLGTNPLTADIPANKKFTVNLALDNSNAASATVTGAGNLYYNTLRVSDNPLFASFKNVIGTPVVLTSSEHADKAVIKFRYETAELAAKGISAQDLLVYKFDNDRKVFVKLPQSAVDTANRWVTAEDNDVFDPKTVYAAASSSLSVNATKAFDVVYALDMTQSLYDRDPGFASKDGLRNTLAELPEGSSVSIVRANPAIETLEQDSGDKELLGYTFEDAQYKPDPGTGDLGALVGKGIQLLSGGSSAKGKVLIVLSAAYNAADRTALTAQIKAARSQGIVVYVTGYSNSPEDYGGIEQLAAAGAGKAAVAANPGSYDIALGELKNDFSFFVPAAAQAGISPPLNMFTRTVKGFDISKHGFKFINFAVGPYGTLSAHSAGFAAAAAMNFAGLLPSSVEINAFEKSLDDKNEPFSFNGQSTAYDLFADGDILQTNNREIAKLDPTESVKKLIAFWWLRGMGEMTAYSDLFNRNDASKSVKSDGFNYLSSNDVDFITDQLDAGYPVYIDFGQSYENASKANELTHTYHPVLIYGYNKQSRNGQPVRIDLQAYDSNHKLDPTRAITLDRLTDGSKLKDEWKYEYDLAYNGTSVYSSDKTYDGNKVTYRRFLVFDMRKYKETFDRQYDSSKNTKATITETRSATELWGSRTGVQTVIKLTVPKEKKDEWTIIHFAGQKGTEVKHEFTATETPKGDFIEYTLKSFNIYNQLAVKVKTEFVEIDASSQSPATGKVNMQDNYPDAFLFPSNNFGDVSGNMWFAREVKTAKFLGIASGYADGLFHPANGITKAELITMAMKASETEARWEGDYSLAKAEADKYTDLTNHWAWRNIGLALARGWVEPGDAAGGLFKPNEEVTREEAAYLLWTIMSSTQANGIKPLIQNNAATPPYSDIGAIQTKYQSAVTLLNLNNIAQGKVYYSSGQLVNKFEPLSHLTRAESCKWIVDFLK
ncbi:Ig-like domain-containing protein [Cohnella faecalis]|uniref:Ig-like domain-containing protein n=1 Tax=Cohnella faecalis TaxID=2315694 RepID=UPI0011C22979|nr:Ig-like domain-containing protein [Cohnella faecalis]